MKKLILPVYLLLMLTLSSRCQPPQKKSVTVETLAAKKLGKGYTIKKNRSNTFALCYQAAGGGQHVSKKSKFMIVKLSTLQIVAEDVFVNGQVQWKSDEEVEYAVTNSSGKAMAEPQLKTISVIEKEM